MSNTDDCIRITSHGGGRKGFPEGFVRLDGLREDEIECLQGMVNGTFWCSVDTDTGRLMLSNRNNPLPGPQDDPFISPYWTPTSPDAAVPGTQLSLFDFQPLPAWDSPSIIIQGLVPYGWTEARYREEADALESYGFTCLRSRRGNDGKYWELWFLCATACAEGDLDAAIQLAQQARAKKKGGSEVLTDWKADLRVAIKFLSKHIVFGSLDVCTQRVAAVVED